MSHRKILFNEPYITGNELTYIEEVFSNQHFQGNGPFTKKNQVLLEKYLGIGKVLLTDSCTSALEISALLFRQGQLDEVILPSYTFSSTASAFARAGYRIIFADIDPITMMLDPADVAKKITANTRAIVPVHYAGFAADLEPLIKLAEEANIKLVEDAAQGLGSSHNGRKLGTFGTTACFSFHETKNLHAGLCGALAINDESLIDRATYIWERGTNRQAVLNGLADKYTWVEVGGSFYPSELQAAFLLAQLETLEQNLAERKALYDTYIGGLASLKSQGLVHYMDPAERPGNNFHALVLQFESTKRCDHVRQYLVARDVHAYIGYVPLHSSPVGIAMGYKPEDLPLTEEYATRVLRMPLHNKLTKDDVQYICKLTEEALTTNG